MRVCLLLLIGLLLIVPVSAQPILDPAAPPERTVTLPPGFAPDPQRVSALTGGGTIDANGRGLGPDCVGFIGAAPDVRVDVAGALSRLRFIFIADSIFTDTTLIVRDPAGRFACGNNYAGLFNPLAEVSPAPPGTYAVWIGGFTPGADVFGALYLSANAAVVPGATDINIPLMTAVPTPTGESVVPVPLALIATPVPASPLTPDAPPQHAAISLTHSFLPDPFWAVVIAGGEQAVPPDLDAASPDLINQPIEFGALVPPDTCAGFTDAAPDVRLTWAGVSTRLRLHLVSADAAADLTLIVRDPAGRYTCNRDFAPGFFNPSVEFLNPVEGDYAIWAAAAGPTDRVIATLYVTELPTTPETVVRAGTVPQPDVTGLSVNPSTALPIALGSADPLVVPGLFAGGEVDIAALNPRPDPNRGCEGVVSTEPTAALTIGTPQPFLRLFAVGDGETSDPTLIVRLPDGTWYCADDSYGTLSPTIDVIGNLGTGTALIWLGSFDSAGTFARLYVSTGGGASPLTPDAAPIFAGLTGAALTAFLPTPTPVPPLALDAISYALTVTPPLLDAALYIATAAPTPIALVTAPPDAASVSGAAQAAAPLDPAAIPNYGEVQAGRGAGGGTIAAIAGGSVDAALIPGCAGFVTTAPDLRVQWSGGAFYVRFVSGTPSEQADPTLIVRRPDGAFVCNDDAFGTRDSYLEIADGLPGTYTIWIGSFTSGVTVPGTLTIAPL